MIRKKGRKKVNSIKTEVDGIKFQSRLEGYAYKELKAVKLYEKKKLLYEPIQFVIVDPFEFDGKKYQSIKITPDFVDEKNKIVFEIKGLPNETFPMRWKLMKKYFKETGENWKVFIGMKNQTKVKEEIVKIKEYYKHVQSTNKNLKKAKVIAKEVQEGAGTSEDTKSTTDKSDRQAIRVNKT